VENHSLLLLGAFEAIIRRIALQLSAALHLVCLVLFVYITNMLLSDAFLIHLK